MVVERSLSSEQHRDLPLTFGLLPGSSDAIQKLVARFGLAELVKADEVTLLHLVAEGVAAARSDLDVSYSRHKPFYTGLQRYYGDAFTYLRVTRCMDLGLHNGLFVGKKAAPGDHRRTKLQSVFRASDVLMDMFEGEQFGQSSQEVIRLKGKDERLTAYIDTSDTVRMRTEIQAINKFLGRIDIGLPSSAQRVGSFVATKEGYQMVSPVKLHRVFNRGSFECGGRAYGWHQNLPKVVRRQLTLNGSPVVELDFEALHPTILLAERGIQRTRDPYEFDIYDRRKWKTAINAAINCRNIHEAKAIIQTLLGIVNNDDSEPWFFIHLMQNLNPEVADAFCSDAGVRLMRKDSDLMIGIMNTLIGQGIPFLPVHDSVIAPKEHVVEVEEIMKSVFMKMFDGITAEIKQS